MVPFAALRVTFVFLLTMLSMPMRLAPRAICRDLASSCCLASAGGGPGLRLPSRDRRSRPRAVAVHRQRADRRRDPGARHRRRATRSSPACTSTPPSDVPRITAVPAWNAIAIFDGERWLDTSAIAAGAVKDYRQVLDMRTGTARTSYDWVNGARRTTVRVETLRLPGRFPARGASGWRLTPQHAGGCAFGSRSRAARLRGGCRSRRSPAPTRSGAPLTIWYPGHMVVRSRAATRAPGGARLSLTSTPGGPHRVLAQAAAVGWPGGLTRARSTPDDRPTRHGRGRVRRGGRPDIQLHPARELRDSATDQRAAPGPSRDVEAARARGLDALAAANALAWARRWETDIEIEGDPALQRVVRSMLFYLLASAGEGTGDGHPADGTLRAADTTAMSSGTPTPGCSPRCSSPIPTSRARWSLSGGARSTPPGPTRGRTASRARCIPGRPTSADGRPRPTFAVQNAKMEIHVNGDVALAQWQYYLATGDSTWLATDGYPVIRETANFWVEPRAPRFGRAGAITSTAWSRCTRD